MQIKNLSTIREYIKSNNLGYWTNNLLDRIPNGYSINRAVRAGYLDWCDGDALARVILKKIKPS